MRSQSDRTCYRGSFNHCWIRNAKQRLIETLQKQFKNANINVKILDIKPTEVPNLYWVNLEE